MCKLELGADATVTDVDGNGAFHLALQNAPSPQAGRSGIAKKVLKSLTPEVAMVDGSKPVGFSSIGKALAARGAYVNLANKEGKTPLHMIMQSQRRSANQQLLDELVEAGADLERRDINGRTPLSRCWLTTAIRIFARR